MLTVTAPTKSSTFEPTGWDTSAGVTDLLDDASGAGLNLPCRVNDADLWFADSPADLEVAKGLCAGCPVLAECLAGALTRREPWGVWGGEIFERGVVIAKKRPRGRPRKTDRVEAPAAQTGTEGAAA